LQREFGSLRKLEGRGQKVKGKLKRERVKEGGGANSSRKMINK